MIQNYNDSRFVFIEKYNINSLSLLFTPASQFFTTPEQTHDKRDEYIFGLCEEVSMLNVQGTGEQTQVLYKNVQTGDHEEFESSDISNIVRYRIIKKIRKQLVLR